MNDSVEIISQQASNDENEEDNNYNRRKKNILLCKIFKTTSDKILLTIILCLVFLNFGICGSILGPSMIELACQTRSTLTEISWLFFIQNFAALIGCIGSGVLINHRIVTPNSILIICTILLPIFVSLIPFPTHLYLLGLVMSLVGLNMGMIDNVGNISMIKLHGLLVAPFIQSLHFFYGLGAFLTPIVEQMFMNTNFDMRTTSKSFNCYTSDDITDYINLNKNSTVDRNYDEIITEMLKSNIEIQNNTKLAFLILSAIQLPVPILLLVFKFIKPENFIFDFEDEAIYENNIKNRGEYNEYTDKEEKTSFTENLRLFLTKISAYFCNLFDNSLIVFKMTSTLAVMVLIFDGLQSTHGGFIYSYAFETYDIDKSLVNISDTKFIQKKNDDGFITASFWLFFAIGRLFSIFIATKFSPLFMILVDVIGCMFSCSLMLISGMIDSQSKVLIYLATCLFGFFLSNATPSSYSLAEIHIGMTPSLTSFLILNAAVGEFVLPLLVSGFFELEGPIGFIVIELLSVIIAFIVFLKFWDYCTQHSKNYDANQSFIWSSISKCENQFYMSSPSTHELIENLNKS